MENKNQKSVKTGGESPVNRTSTKMAKKIVFVIRVPYGKESTPEADREYQIEGKGPVGTIQELIDAGFTPVIEEVGTNQKHTYWDNVAENEEDSAYEEDHFGVSQDVLENY